MAASLPAPLTRPMRGAETARRRRGTTSAGPAPRSADSKRSLLMMCSGQLGPHRLLHRIHALPDGGGPPRRDVRLQEGVRVLQRRYSGSSVDGPPRWPCLCRSGGAGPADPGAGQAECVDHIRPQIPPGETTTTIRGVPVSSFFLPAGDTLDSASFSHFSPNFALILNFFQAHVQNASRQKHL